MIDLDCEIRNLAARRERYALAVLGGADNGPEILADMREASRQLATLRDAQAMTARRAGGEVWSWPARAPWAGF